MTLQDLHELLIAHSGVTIRVTREYLFSDSGPSAPASSLFFKPFKSKLAALENFASILTGPLVLSVFALEYLVVGIAYVLKGLFDMLRGNPSESMNSFENSGTNLLQAGALILTAAISPLVNLIDAIGSSLIGNSSDLGVEIHQI